MCSVPRHSFVVEQAPECGTLTIKSHSNSNRQYNSGSPGSGTSEGGRVDLSTLLGPEGSVALMSS